MRLAILIGGAAVLAVFIFLSDVQVMAQPATVAALPTPGIDLAAQISNSLKDAVSTNDLEQKLADLQGQFPEFKLDMNAVMPVSPQAPIIPQAPITLEALQNVTIPTPAAQTFPASTTPYITTKVVGSDGMAHPMVFIDVGWVNCWQMGRTVEGQYIYWGTDTAITTWFTQVPNETREAVAQSCQKELES